MLQIIGINTAEKGKLKMSTKKKKGIERYVFGPKGMKWKAGKFKSPDIGSCAMHSSVASFLDPVKLGFWPWHGTKDMWLRVSRSKVLIKF